MKVLFVGNSHTYMNDMPEMVRINSSGPLEVTMLARPAVTFHDHLESMELQFALKQDYDIVVFQQAAHYPCPSKEETLEDAKKLVALARNCGVLPYIMIPWAQKDHAEDFKVIKDIYHTVMMDNMVDGIPVGYIIDNLNRNYPKLELFQDDQQHLSVIGSYIESIVILNTIFFQEEFSGSLIDYKQTAFEYQQLNSDLTSLLSVEIKHLVDLFRSNYCVCGKRCLLDD